MKKRYLFVFALVLCLLPSFALFACTQTTYHLITALPSDSLFGQVEGMDNFNEKVAGTKITLTAIEKNETNNPFVCWIKDNKEIVGTERSLSLTYGQETEGDYTALFKENDQDKMLYSKFDSASVDTKGISTSVYSISSIVVQLQWSRIDIAESENPPEIEINFASSGSSQTLKDFDDKDVFYFGSLGQSVEYKFKGKVIIVGKNRQGQETTDEFNLTFQNNLSKSLSFNGGKCILNGSFAGKSKNINITFVKF